MIFTKITMKNFKSYLNTTIDLNQGISIIVGENGAGKSTILEAISFALFKQYDGKLNDLIKMDKDTDLNRKMSVVLEFSSNGNHYKVKRERTKTSSKAYLFIRDKKTINPKNNDFNNSNTFSSNTFSNFIRLCSGDKEVNKEIQLILKMDSELFLNAIYIKQGEIADLIGKTSAEKKKLIVKLLGIDSLETAWKNSLPIINSYENKKSELKGLISSDSKLVEEFKTKKVLFNDLKHKKSKLDQDLLELKNFNKEKKKEKERMGSEKSVYETLNSNLIKEQEIVDQIKKDKNTFLIQLNKIKEFEKEIEFLKPKVDKLPIYLSFQESIKNIIHLKEDEKKLKNQLDAVDEYNNILVNEKDYYEKYKFETKKLEELKEKKSKLEGDLKLLSKTVQDRDSIDLEIKQEKDKINTFFKNVNKALKVESEDFNQLNSYLNKTKDKLQSKIGMIGDKLLDINQNISSLNEKVRSSKDDLSQLEKAGDECPVCKSEITLKKRDQLNKSFNDNIKENSNLIEKSQNDIKKLKYQEKFLVEKLNEIEDFIKESFSYKSVYDNLIKDLDKKSKFDHEINVKNESKIELGDILSEIAEKEESLLILKEHSDNYLKSKGSLDALGKQFIIKDDYKKVLKSIDKEVNEIKIATQKDKFLSTKIEEEELKAKISDLKKEDMKYNQLKGRIKQKDLILSQIENKNKDIKNRQSEIEKFKEDIKSSIYTELNYKKVNHSFDTSLEKISEIDKNIGELEGKLSQLKIAIDELNLKLENNEKYQKEFDNVDDFLKLLVDIRDLYSKNGVQKTLRHYSKPIIEKYTKEFFDEFNFNYSDLHLDDDYEISVFGSEGETKLEMLSGGEKIAVALALRLGITKALSKGNMDTILLDEPTIHLDNYRRSELIEILRKMSILPQMIIVTHDSELETAADNIIKIKKENGVSDIVV